MKDSHGQRKETKFQLDKESAHCLFICCLVA